MSTQRVMSGVANFEGKRINTLRIGAMVSRHPLPKYQTVCERCGTQSTVGQREIATGAAHCRNSGCGKDKLRAYLSDTPRKALEREAERKRAAVSAAEKALQTTADQISRTIRERIANGRDADIFVTPELRNVKMTEQDAIRFNKQQAAQFASETPEYESYRSDATFQAIGNYFERNGIAIADAAMIRAAFERLRTYGLIHPNTVAQQELEPEAEPEPLPEPESSGVELFIGRDWETGNRREFTRREIDRMSADEYRKAFPVATTFSSLFTAMGQSR